MLFEIFGYELTWFATDFVGDRFWRFRSIFTPLFYIVWILQDEEGVEEENEEEDGEYNKKKI